jgi:large subunit ribosomal protein L13Ae
MAKPSRKNAARSSRKGAKKHTPEIIVVDLKDHMVGRAAAVIAKQLLLGKRITVVRCDEANIAGKEIRNKVKYLNFLRKRKLTNPTLGPFHHRAPADVFMRVIRGMLPFYTKRGKLAIRRLQAFEGVPSSIARKGQRYTIPKAQRHNRLQPERAFTVLGNMCQHVGWKYKGVVDRLEKARKEKAARHHAKRATVRAAWDQARKEALTKISTANRDVLKKFGVA